MRRRIAASRARAALSVNRELIELYWQIGREILRRQEERGWGAKVIDQLARDLKEEGHRGFSRSNLHYMRSFAAAWPAEETRCGGASRRRAPGPRCQSTAS